MDPKDAPERTEPTEKVAGPSPQEPDWESQAKEWEGRAKGWQRQFQVLQDEKANWEATQQGLQTSLQEAETKVGTLTAENQALQKQLDEWSEESDKLSSAHEELTAVVGKYELIREEFPTLLPFTKMIPTTGEPEAQRETLQEWATTMDRQIEEAATRRVELALKGVSPPASPPRGTPVFSREELADRMDEIAGRPGYEEEYQKLYKQWTGLDEAE